jgi:hypothetical protein
MKEKEQIRMLLHPENYTEEQLSQMLDEANIPVPDANEEWERFSVKCRTENSKLYTLHSKLIRIAATFIGVLILSGIAYAAINHFLMVKDKPKVALTERTPDVNMVENAYGVEMIPTDMAPVVFNNVELQQIMQYVANGYGVKVAFMNDSVRTIRFYLQWEADDTLLEIINKINHFEKVHLTLNEETITIQ